MNSLQMTRSLAAFGVLAGTFLMSGGEALASSCAPATTGKLCTTYALSGVTLTADPAASAGILIPVSGMMTGQFNWEYTPGDFTNGSGAFTSLDVPWTYHGFTDLTLQIDNVSLNGTLPGNFHSDGVDFTIALSPGLSSPNQGAPINFSGSTFDIWGGGREYVGNVTSGSIVVAAVPLPAAAWLFGSGLFGVAWITRKRKVA